MALQFIDLTPDGVSGFINVDFERTSERTYLAYFDPTDDENFVRANCGYHVGARHPTDVQQVLTQIHVDINGPLCTCGQTGQLAQMWTVKLSYGTWNPAERGDPATAGNPLLMPTRWRLEWEKVPEPVFNDINGAPILNTASDPFDPPVERSGLVGILTVRRNEANPAFAQLIGLAESINTAEWLGFGPKTVRFAPPVLPELEYSQETQTYYYPMTYVFEINPRNWQAKPLNAGFRENSPTQQNQNRKLLILDDAAQPLQSPGLLDKNGVYLKPPIPQKQALYLTFDIYQDVDFGQFDLDDLFTPPAVLS